VDFETDPQREARRIRLDNPSGADVGGYVDEAGAERQNTGNADAPYASVLGRVSASGTSAPTVADDETQEILTDEFGRIWARSVPGERELERVTTAGTPLLQTAPIKPLGEALRVRWAGVSLVGGAAAGRVLMIFDTSSTVTANTVPIWRGVILDAGAGYFNSIDIEFEVGGLEVTDGIVLAVSTTLDVLTFPGAAEGFFQLFYTRG